VNTLRGFFALACCALLGGGMAAAQTTGSVEGTVRDTAGAPLSEATLEVRGPSFPGSRQATTDVSGKYWFPALPSGGYTLTAGRSGFHEARASVSVVLDESAKLDLVLEPAIEEKVSVSGEAPLVDVTSTSSGTSYTSKVTEKLPVSRNYADVVRMNPGVSTDRGLTQGRSVPLAIQGATSAENLWLIEGVDTTHVVYGIQGKLLNSEFVQEVQVKTSGYQAEYGGALGGIVNVVTRSGGNVFHGGAFAQFFSGATRAEPVVSADQIVDSQKRTPGDNWDAGADLGGFILKDRIWFYGVYNRVLAPVIISNQEDPTDPRRFRTDAADSLYGGKLTANLSAETSVVGTVFADPTTRRGPECGNPIDDPDPLTWQCGRLYGGLDAALRLDQLLGSKVFLFAQVSRHRDSFALDTTGLARSTIRTEDLTCDEGAPPGTLEQPCDRPDFPNSATGGIGLIDGASDNSTSHRLQYRATATLYLGEHQVKAGGEYQQLAVDAVSLFTGGQFVTRLDDYGTPYYQHTFFSRSRTDLTPVDAVKTPRTRRLALFAEDSFHPAPGLTIDVGLRWSQNEFRTDEGVTFLKTTNEWQPRLGVAWDPWKDGKTRVYASAGRFYYALPLDLAILAFGNQVITSTFNFDPVSLTPANVPGVSPNPHPEGSLYAEPVDSGLGGIYQDEYVVGIERALTPSLSIGIKGTYRRLGRTIEDRCDIDGGDGFGYCALVNPGSSGHYAAGAFATCNGLSEPFHECGVPGVATPAARRLYRAFEILAKKTVGDRLWLQASYVYASLRGNYDGLVNAYGQTSPGILIDFDYPFYSRNTYGRLDQDRPHQGRLDAAYTFPFRAFAGFGFYAQSGAPGNKTGFLNGGYYTVPLYLEPKGSGTRLPTLWEANVTAGYPISVGSAVTVTAQVYVDNLFNHQFPTGREWVYRRTGRHLVGYPDTIYDTTVPEDSQYEKYNWVDSRQDPRLFRASLRVTF